MTITIHNYRAPSRNKTAFRHWRTYKGARDEMAALLAAETGYKKFEPLHKVKVIIEAWYKGKRCVDTSNLDDKIIIDGLMHIGLLEDDNPKENPIVEKIVFSETGADLLKITVREIWK